MQENRTESTNITLERQDLTNNKRNTGAIYTDTLQDDKVTRHTWIQSILYIVYHHFGVPMKKGLQMYYKTMKQEHRKLKYNITVQTNRLPVKLIKI